jgi:membrane protein DedA with SNARE-associated domain
MPILPFLAWSTLGSLAWSGLLAISGFWLESRYEQVAVYVDPVAKAVLGLMVASYFYRVVTYRTSA